MNFLAYLRGLGAKLFRKSALADEMEEELRAHLDLRADDLARSGMDRAEADRRARIEFGAQAKFQEQSYEALGGNFLDSLIRDVRLALRVLRKPRGFTFAAIVTLALAIGANAVVFGVLDALLLHPLHVPRPETLYGTPTVTAPGSSPFPITTTCATATTASKTWRHSTSRLWVSIPATLPPTRRDF
jgi:hypothetical protein